MELRQYYMNLYPTDDMGYDISSDATWVGLLKTLNVGNEVYDYIGVVDSLVRERLFEGLSEVIGVSYDEIYNKWINIEL